MWGKVNAKGTAEDEQNDVTGQRAGWRTRLVKQINARDTH